MNCSYLVTICMVFIKAQKDLIASSQAPDIILATPRPLADPANMYLFADNITNYYIFGKSAMSERVALGPIVGRPYGGTSVLVKNKLLELLNVFSVPTGMLLSELEI